MGLYCDEDLYEAFPFKDKQTKPIETCLWVPAWFSPTPSECCIQMAKAFLPAMLERNQGHIVTVSSIAGLFGNTGLVDYCASKFAAVGFNEALSLELTKLGKDGVKTTIVCPYLMNTGMFEGVKVK